MGLDLDKQYEYLEENYELLSLLLSREGVEWLGRHRPDLHGATTLPRSFAGPFRIWHGSATSQFAVDLAARHGDPLISANALQPRESYQVLIDRYREQYEAHGHDPAYAFVGSGSGGLFLADTTEQAVERYPPLYEGAVARQDLRTHVPGSVGKVTSFRTIEEAVERRPALVGSPERVAEKILDYYASHRHDLQSVSINNALEPAHQDGPADARRPAAFTAGG